MSSFLKIRDIFFSGAHAFAGNADAIGEITFLVDEGYLTIDQVVVADKSGYIRLLDDEAFYKESMGKISGGGLSHIILKKLSGHYLMEHRGLAVYYEHPFVGYYPDVISKNKLVVVECGHTANPEKMLMYFTQGKIQECIQVPYPDHGDYTIRGHSFKANANLKDFLSFLESERLVELRKLIDSRK